MHSYVLFLLPIIYIYIYYTLENNIYIYNIYNLSYIYISYITCMYIYIYNVDQIYIYMAMSQNCVWNVPRCSGRMERRGFVTGLVPDLWNVMKYKLCVNINICILYICVIYVYIITSQGYARWSYYRWLPLIFTSHLRGILVVHLFNAGLPCMASARALART